MDDFCVIRSRSDEEEARTVRIIREICNKLSWTIQQRCRELLLVDFSQNICLVKECGRKLSRDPAGKKRLYQFFDNKDVKKVHKDAMDEAEAEYHDRHDKFQGDSMCIDCYEQINPPHVKQGALLLPVKTNAKH